jgi:hypothetical protein
MGLHDKEERANHYDDFLTKLKDDKSESIDDAIDKIKKFQEKGNMHHYMLNKFQPAQTKLYDTFRSKLADNFGDGHEQNVSGEDNQKKVKNALFEALKEYMKIVRPGAIETIDEIGIGEDDGLEHLMSMYDNMIGYNPDNKSEGAPQSIKNLLAYAKDKDSKTGDLLQYMISRKDDIQHSWSHIANKFVNQHINDYDSHQFLKHAFHKLKDHGLYQIADKSQFINQDKSSLFQLINAVNYDDYANINIKKYGIEKKPLEEKHH